MSTKSRQLFPLTHAQQRIWYTELLYPDTSACVLSGSITLRGQLNLDKLQQAIQLTIRQNDAFRVKLTIENGEPRQYIEPYAEKEIEFLDFSGNDDRSQAEAWLKLHNGKPFEPIDSDLYEFVIVRASAMEIWCVLKMHHIVSDGISMNLIGNQIIHNYVSLNGDISAAANEKPSYFDYLHVEQEYEGSDRYQKDRTYWLDKFRDLPELTGLKPYNPLSVSTAAKRISVTMDDALYRNVQRFCEANKLGVFTFFLGCLYIYLYKVTNERELTVGTVYANRTTKKEKDMIGMFASTVATRLTVEPEQDLISFLRLTAKEQSAILRHQKYPYNQLIQDLRDMHKGQDIQRLFGIAIEYQPMSWLHVDNISYQTSNHFCGHEVNDFAIHVKEMLDEQHIELIVDYRTEVFEEYEVNAMIQRLLAVAGHIVSRPSDSISEVSLISEEEKRQILTVFNETASDYPREKTIAELFEAQALQTPEQTALVFEGSRMTYEELNERANRLARTLRAQGVQTDQPIGLMAERSMEMVVGVFAILKAGGAYVPIDPEYPQERIRYMLDDSGTSLLVLQSGLRNRVSVESYSGKIVELDDAAAYDEDGSNLEPAGGPDSLAYVMYTSGTTGRPKGNLTTHRNIVRVVRVTNYIDITGQDQVLQLSSYAFDGSTFDIFGALLNGARLVLCSKQTLLDMGGLAALIAREHISVMFITTALFNVLVDLNIDCLRHVRKVLFGGERISVSHARRALHELGPNKLIHVYGPTESTVFATFYGINKIEEHAVNVPIGRPISNTSVYIVGAGNQLQPVGVAGELCVAGDGLARGYLNRPELTADKFAANPFAPGERMYRTGDLARWLPDGSIEYIGRIDQQVKIRGFRIELGEIEALLAKTADVREAVVIAREDEAGQKHLVAYFVADKPLAVSDLRSELAQELPAYMIPTHFVQLEQLPLTPNGKVDRRALPAPEGGMVTEAEFVAPRTPLEVQLARIWQEVLAVPKVGVKDNFFDLGGHSLRATALVAHIHKEMNRSIPLKTVFQSPTIEQLAETILSMDSSVYAAIPVSEERSYYPVSSAQKRLFILNQLEGFEGAELSYNMPGVMTVEGPLNVKRLEEAFRSLIERHESLRTGFELENGEPVQRVYQDVDFAVELVKAAGEDADAIISGFVREFDLRKPPLLRVGLIELERERHMLLFDMHHIVSDGASIGILIEEFVRLYGGETLSPLRIQYKDYAAWQQAEAQSERVKTQEAYWLEQYRGSIPVLDMPADYPRPAVRSYRGDRLEFVIDRPRTDSLRQLAAQTGSTLYMVLLAAFTTLLHKYSGQEDIIVGSPIAGRPHADLDGIIGMFVNTLAIRSFPAGGKTFQDHLLEIKDSALKAYENQDYPFEELVEKLDLKRDVSRHPLFDTVFVLQNAEQGELAIDGLRFKPYPVKHHIAKFDLTFHASEEAERIACHFEYATSLYTPETMKRMANHLLRLIDAMAESPQMTLSSADIVTPQEMREILEQFNDTDADYPREKTIHQLFEEQAERTPDHAAVEYEGRVLTYRELNERANRLASTLRAEGVQSDQLVGIMAERSIEMVVGILAILKAGGAYVPVDPEYPQERIRFMLDDSGAQLLLVQGHLRDSVTFAGTVIELDNEASYSGEAALNLVPASGPHHLAYVIYTSGTTGKPKGTLIEHKNVVRLLFNSKSLFDFDASDTWTLFHSFCFDFSVWEMYGALLYGGKLVIVPSLTAKSPKQFLQLLHERRVTILNQTPTYFYQLLQEALSKGEAGRLSLRKVIFGGEALSPYLLKDWKAAYPDVQLINMYGITETTVHVTYKEITSVEIEQAKSNIGKPIPTLRTYILDEHRRPVPVGVAGELYVAGDGLARGYLNRPDLTAEKFVDHPFVPGERLYRAGDLARWLPDGSMEYLGRIDHQVKIRGYRIELGEVEAQLAKAASVQEAVVVARDDEAGHKQLVAYFVADKPLTVNELRSALSQEMPAYMIPSYFVQLERMPLTSNGKVDRKALPAPQGGVQTGADYVAPRTPVETLLVRIWQEVLGVQTIGVKDNFFDLGGHSLRATALVAQIHKELNRNVPLKTIFQLPTIEQLAGEISGMEASAYAAIPVTEDRSYYPVSSAQKRLFILNQLEGFDGAELSYNMPGVMTIEGPLDPGRLEGAFRRLIERHESLRTSFALENGEPVQRIHRDVDFAVEVMQAAEEEVDAAVRGFVREFDLRMPPLLRVGLIRLERERHLLLFDMHHIVSDGASIGILIEEFVRLYKGESLAPLRIQYKDYAAWQQTEAHSERLMRQEAYWLGQYRGDIPALDMPTDYARPAVWSYRGNRLEFVIDEARSAALRRLAAQTGSTLYMVLLSVYTTLLHKYTGQEDIIVGSPIAGRPHADLSGIIGMFVNTLAIRSYPAAEKSFLDYLQEVQQRALQAFENQDYPFEELVEKLDLKRDLSRNPLFDTMFVLQNAEQGELAIEGLKLGRRSTGEFHVSKYDLTLSAEEQAEQIVCQLEYAASLFKPETVRRMASHLLRLIDAIVNDPQSTLSSLNMVTADERLQILEQFNDTYAEFSRDKTIYQLFEEQAERTPEQTAVVFAGRGLTYRELNERANRLARTLRAEGVRAERIAGIMAERSLEMIVGLLAIMKAGGAYVPIDPEYPQERIRYMLDDSGAELLLLQGGLRERVSFAGSIIELDDPAAYDSDGSNLELEAGPNDLAYVIYTSGTTGRPKGVMIEHRSIANTITWKADAYRYSHDDRALMLTPFVFDPFLTHLFGPLVSGAAVHLLNDEESKDAPAIRKALADSGITHLQSSPSFLMTLLEHMDTHDVQSLKNVVVGGEKLSSALVQKLKTMHPAVEICNEYGPTENSVVSTSLRIDHADQPLSIGKPIANNRVYIVGGNNQLQPVGVPGELCLAGAGLARGYLNMPELTAEKFTASPFAPGERMYRTGDLARWLPDGSIEYLGRIDDQVKIRGFRIELGEVEAQLLRTASVQEAVVTVRESDEGQKQLCAYFVADKPLAVGELRSALAQELPAYMIPSYFVQLERMPLTPNGKIDRKALPAPEGSVQTGTAYVAPRTPLEAELVQLWQEVLGLPGIGVKDNFFDLGGHSLRATTLIAKIHKQLDIHVPLREVFRAPTVEQLSEVISGMKQTAYAAIPVTEERASYPVSSAQKRLYILNQLEGAELSYNMPGAMQVEGPLDRDRLAAAFRKLIARHETLRTGFELANGEPVQRVQQEVDFAVEYWTVERSETVEEHIRSMMRDFVRPFDLQRPPLLRAGLIRLEQERHLLLFDMHHIISDGASMNIFMKEFVQLYNGEELSPLRVQYKDYAAWQQKELHSPRMSRQEAYWLDVFGGDIPVLDMPTDYSRPAVRTFRGDTFEAAVDRTRLERLRQLASQTGTTLYMVLLAAYTALLHKYTGQEDIVVGTPIAGRTHADLEPMIGMFVGTLAIRSCPEGEKTFRDHVLEIKELALKAYENQEYPFEDLVDRLDLNRDMSRNPLFDTMFVLQSGGVKELSIEGLTFTPNAGEHRMAKFDLTFNLFEEADKLICSIEYATALYKRETVERMAMHFLRLIDAVTLNMEAKLSSIEIVSDQEKLQLMEQFNDTYAAYPRGKTIHRLFEEQAERTPEQAAVIFAERSLTYRELNEQANRLARTLRGQGVQAERIVGIMAERSLEMIVGLLAIMKAGGAYVPIDPEYPQERIRFMLDDSGAQLLLLQAGLQDRVSFAGSIVELGDPAAYDRDGSNLGLEAGPNDLAYVIYTSGTTGRPKGVMIEHRSIANTIGWKADAYRFTRNDRALMLTPFVFDPFLTHLFGPLVSGATVYLLSDEDSKEPSAIRHAIAESGITHLQSSPSFLMTLLEHMNSHDVRSLKNVVVGGEKLTSLLVQKLKAMHPAVEICNEYGPTENSVVSTSLRIDHADQPLSIGKPIANNRVYIVGAHNQLQPVGVPGELCLAGAGLARGYLNMPELTAEKFTASPFAPGERMYRTGDLARWLPDGSIEYLGRIDDQVKIRGFRIELGEVEAHLLKAASVQEAVVTVRESGDGQKQLCAYFVADKPLAVGELRSALAQELPAYMIPSFFVQLERMPLTPNGKIDRKALPAPDESVQTGAEYVAPRSPVERTIIEVWQKVLGTGRPIGVLDNFFELGGDSIKAIQVSARLHQAGYKLEIKNLFKYPTVAELNPYVQPSGRRADQGEVQGEMPLTPIQRWFFGLAYDEPHHFNQAVMLYREEGFEETALRQAVRKLAEHHDALRLVFRRTESGYAAYNRGISEGELYSLDVMDFREKAGCSRDIADNVSRLQRGIHLQTGPLLKLGLFRCADGDHLLIVVHHLAVDGVSWRILFEDLASGYEQAVRGQVIRLPDKTDSFRMWAERLAAYAGSTAMESERAYWERIAQAGSKPLTRDFAQERAVMGDSETVTIRWTRDETERLLKQAHRAYGTDMNDLLLTALGMAVHEWTGMEQIAVELEGHGRESVVPDIDITRTVGWFTSQYPVVLDMKAGQEVAQRIKSVKESLRQIPNKGIGCGILKYMTSNMEGGAFREHAYTPEISFNYLGQFDQDLQNNALQISPYSSGQTIGESMPRTHSLDVNGMIAGGELSLTLVYSGKMYRKETMEGLAGMFRASLRDVITHCIAKERPELTPSDVLYKGLTIEELDRLQAQTAHIGEIENVYLLTPMQKGMLFHSLMDAGSGVYFEQATFTVHGSLDEEAFGKSLEALTQRHAVLRTNFYSGWKEEPMQVVFRSKRPGYRYEDIRGIEEERRESYLDALKQEDKARGFDLAEDALIRVSIVRTGDETYRFLWSFHHILMDGWCVSLVTKEVFDVYFAMVKHQQPMLGEAYPYSQYIEWLERQDREAASAYWSDYLAEYEHQTALPQAKAADKTAGYAPEKLVFSFGRELTEAIDQTAKREQVTVNSLLQTAWGIVLQRYNGTQDAVFGSVVSGRPAEIPGIETMIGLFINTIPVRVRCEAEEPFAAAMRRVQEQALASQTYDTYPLYEIQAHSERKQDLISHIMVFENYPVEQRMEQLGSGEPAGLAIADVEMVEQTNYDLNVIVIPGDEIGIRLEYNASVYDRSIMERIKGHLIRVLGQIASKPDIRVSELELLSAEEREQITMQFNATAADYPRDKTIHQLFEEQAERTPEQVAVKYEDSRLTYRELNELANRLARSLRSAGVEADQPVALMAERSLEMIVGIYAILKAGGAYVPIDPQLPTERIRFMLEDSGAKLLLHQERLWRDASFVDMVADRSLSGLTLIDLNDAAAYDEDGSNLTPVSGPEHMAYVIYTSGSTGRPKGVMVEHRPVVNRLLWMQSVYPIDTGDTILQKTAITFDVSVWELFWWSWTGASVCLLAPGGEKNPETILHTIERHSVTTMHFVPSMLSAFLEYVERQPREALHTKLSSLKQVFTSGEALAPSHVSRFAEWIAPAGGAKLINLYGPTEATVDVSYYECEAERDYASVPIGKPISNIQLFIVSLGSTALQPVGVPGELCIAGDGLARGYLNRPDLTAEKFVDCPFALGGRMYRTGDLAKWLPDGTIAYLGRIDHQVKIRGYRIELGEVEAQLLKAASVQEAAVIAREDDAGQKQLCAYYVADKPLAAGELRMALAATLPAYMVPSYFVQVERMPLTHSGKLDRKALPAPEGSVQTGADHTAPRTPVEAQLVQVWKQVLKLEQVGVKDNFFDLGGHSLRATTMAAQIHQVMGIQVPLRDIFEAPTIEQLARVIAALKQTTYASIPVAEERDYYPVSSAQKRLYLLSHLEGGELSYNMPNVMTIEGPLDRVRLEEAFRKLIERHETLRTGFETVNGEPVQRVHPHADFAVELEQTKERVPATAAEQTEGTGHDEADSYLREFMRPFDLEKPPLLRVKLVELAPDRHMLLFDMHHIISDGVSMGILVHEFVQLYGGEQLAPLRIQYKDYAVWQQRLTESERYREMEQYWLESFEGPLPVLDMPTDYPRPALQSFEGGHSEFKIDTELTGALKRLSDEHGCTLFMVLLAAYTVLLSHYSGQEDIIVGTPIAGRASSDVQPIIGMFINTLALRNYPAEEKTFRDFLLEVKDNALQAYENQEYPFEQLVEQLNVARDPSRNPLFDTMFVLQNAERQELQIESLQFIRHFRESGVSKLDLTLTAAELDDELICTVTYAAKLFKKTTIEKLSCDYVAILSALVKSPHLPLGELEYGDNRLAGAVLAASNEFAF
ncbi:non-ribosomal peptide synthase/polyketide synthase [Paenibacillus chartarius]|uniref:Non-ribosomal peptide synthase/polyketide synthase n=1 Tax=Paenibacillus chartarius TaxID=747481 RepID=A0ABV6DE20_9BACL